MDKKAEDGYKIGGPTTWPTHEANALCQFTWQYSVSMYISPEEWELSGFNLFFEVICNLEKWIFGNIASSEDVSDGNSVKSVRGNVATPVGETDTEPKLKT